MSIDQIKNHLLDYLKENKLFSLATYGADGPWANTAFFAYDNDLNIYFYSKPETRHCKNLTSTKIAALTVNQEWGGKGFIKGMQYQGEWVELDEKSGYETAFSVFLARYKWAERYGDHRVYMIKPREVWMIDSKEFGHQERVRVL